MNKIKDNKCIKQVGSATLHIEYYKPEEIMLKKYGVFKINSGILEFCYMGDTKKLAKKFIENFYLANQKDQTVFAIVDLFINNSVRSKEASHETKTK